MKCIYLVTALSIALSRASTASQGSPGAPPYLAPSWSAGRPAMDHPREGTRRGGGSRGDQCNVSNRPPLTALMPDTSTWRTASSAGSPDIVFSFTQRAAPDLWFYLPAELATNGQITFTLKTMAGDTLKRAQLTGPRPTEPSIVRVSFTELELTLESATDYRWYLTVNCGSGPPLSVDGWIQHQPDPQPDQTNQQFLVDTLSTLAVAQWSTPEDGSSAWRSLLESIGLGDIADTPPVDCCSFVE